MNFCRATGVMWVDVGCHSDHPFLLQCLTSLWPLLSLLYSMADDANSSAESRALIRAVHLFKWIRDMAAAGMTIANFFWPFCHLKQMLLTTKAAMNACITAAITALNLLSPGMINPTVKRHETFLCIGGNQESVHSRKPQILPQHWSILFSSDVKICA